MPVQPLLAKMPRPALFALVGTLAGLLTALTAGELVWYLLNPSAPQPAPALRDERPAEPHTPPPQSPSSVPQLAVTAAPVTAYPGGKNTFGVRVARDKFDGPVTVRFDVPGGLTAAEISIPAGDAAGKAELVAPADAKPGTYALTATASAAVDDRTIRASASVQVTVPAAPPPPARMAVSTSQKIQAYQKGKNTFTVRVARADFDDEITVTFEGVPDGVKIPALTVPAGKTEAVAEVTAAGAAKIGSAKIVVTARAAPKGVATSAGAEVVAEVLDPSRAPLDIVLVLDCTGSMRDSVAGLARSFPSLSAELAKARFDVRFGLVCFRDTTLAQPLEEAKFGGERMTTDAARVAEEVRGWRLGGGGGDGESSLDGVARAADYPLRAGAARVVLLVTDGGPKRSDGRVKSIEAAADYLRTKRIDQLHVVAVPEYRKRFEPLWEGPKGKYFDLKAATAGEFDKLMTDLSKTIAEAVPPQPEPKPEPAPTAPAAVLPEPEPVKPPDPPASREPDEPRFAPPAPAPAPSAPSPSSEPNESRPAPEAPARSPLALGAWAITVACLACLVLFLSQWTVLPGERPTGAVGAVGYGGGLVLGLVAGALGYIAFDAAGVALLARLGGACLFGLGVGLTVPLAERLLRADAPATAPALPRSPPRARAPLPELDLPTVEAYPTSPKAPTAARPRLPELDLPTVEAYPSRSPSPPPSPPPPRRAPLLDLDLPPVEAYPTAPAKAAPSSPPAAPPPAAPPVHKPNITGAPKPGDGCPKCGRKVPGAVGTRYCMLCDNTF